MMIAGVSCDEIVRAYEEGVGPRGPYGVKMFGCAWADRYAVANGMLGLSSYTGPGAVSFTAPASHPETPRMLALDVSIAGVGRPSSASPQMRFERAIVRVTYGVPEYGPLDYPPQLNIDPTTPFIYAEQSLDFGVQYVTIPGKKLKVAGGPFPQDYPIPVQHAEMTIVLHKLPYMPVALLTLIDHVNAGTFLGCAEDKVKFNGCRTHRQFQSDGQVTQEVTLGLSYRPQHGWNQVPDPYADGWTELTYQDNSLLFPRSDLSVIFPTAYHA